ncbi:MAG: hypothetical protein ACYDG2_25255 [Ruminiclostridium sp.]
MIQLRSGLGGLGVNMRLSLRPRRARRKGRRQNKNQKWASTRICLCRLCAGCSVIASLRVAMVKYILTIKEYDKRPRKVGSSRGPDNMRVWRSPRFAYV